jgi:hypothetical protein
MKYYFADTEHKRDLRNIFRGELFANNFFIIFKEGHGPKITVAPEPSPEDKLLLLLRGDLWEFDFSK